MVFHRSSMLTLTAVAAVHATLLYMLLAQQVEPVQKVNKRVIQGRLLATPLPRANKPKETKPTLAKPKSKKEVVQKTLERPEPKLTTTPEAKTIKQVVEKTIEDTTQNQAENDVEDITITTPSIDDAARLKNPPPSYPRLSKRLREEGLVILELWVLKDGTVADINVKTSSGYPRLDKAALEAVSKWRYIPATRSGEAISFRYEQPIEFAMK